MQQEHRIVDVAGLIAVGCAECELVEFELGKCLAGTEAKIQEDDRSICRGPSRGLGRRRKGPTRGGW